MDQYAIILNIPSYSASAEPDPEPSRQKLDGITLPYAEFTYLDNDTGTILVRFTMPASIASKQVLVGSSDTATTNDWFEVGIDSDARLYLQTSDGGALRTIKAVTVLDASTEYTAAIVFDGVDYYVRVNGVEENPLTIEDFAATPGWLGTVASGDALRVGTTATSAGNQRAFGGTITAVEIYSVDITI